MVRYSFSMGLKRAGRASTFVSNHFDVPWRAWDVLIAPFDNQHVFTLLANGLERTNECDHRSTDDRVLRIEHCTDCFPRI